MPYFKTCNKNQMRVCCVSVFCFSSFLVLLLHSVLVISYSGLLTLYLLIPLAALGLYTFIPILYLKQKITVCLVFLLYGMNGFFETNQFFHFLFLF